MAERIGGFPIECFTGEAAAVWSGWRTLGDREIVREASAKGTHIHLAYKHLSYKRNCSIDQAQDYFNKEVQIWINELLEKRQIYRASHILKNMGKDSADYVRTICLKSEDPVLRDYLCKYLLNINAFEDKHLEALTIMKCMTEHEKQITIHEKFDKPMCIKDIMNLPEVTKYALCIELYFYTNEHNLLNNVPAIVIWNFLLSANQINEIQLWIGLQYNNETKSNSDNINEYLQSLFIRSKITSEMIESIDVSSSNVLVKELVKNNLCRYGVFVETERYSLKLTLKRIFGSAITMKEFELILCNESCNIDQTEFLQNVDKQLCIASSFKEKDEECNANGDAKIIHLYNVLCEICEGQSNYHNPFIHGIFQTIQYFSDDINQFLKENHLITFILVYEQYCTEKNISKDEINQRNHTLTHSDGRILYKGNTLKYMFTSKSDLQIGNYIISNEILQNTVKQIPRLQQAISEQTILNNITVYDLLDGYKNLNVQQLFKWHYAGERMPHFANDGLVSKYGHKEALTYTYYLKEARPCMAICNLIYSQGKLCKSLSTQRKIKIAHYAHTFALKNLNNLEIICACISFIEMLGISSECLRLHITATNYVKKQLNICIGSLLQSAITKGETNIKPVISCLENGFQIFLQAGDIINDTIHFIECLKTWDIIVRLARAHNYSLPESLLKFLAKHNLWFEFILIGDLFIYPVDQMMDNIKLFKDPYMQEHLLSCLNNKNLSKSSLVSDETVKFKSRDARQSLYYKIGLKQSVSPAYSSSLSSTDTSNLSSSDSVISTSLYTSITNMFSINDNLWLMILKCHQSQDPPGALLNAARVTLKPIFIVLATCYEPTSTKAYCFSWMVISTADETIISDYAECIEQQVWSAHKVTELHHTMVKYGYINTLSRAYKIFMPESPFNPFFEFFKQCINYGEFETCQKYLKDFKSCCAPLKFNKIDGSEYTETRYCQNLYWIAITAIGCIMTALGYSFQSSQLQIKFLQALIKCKLHKSLSVDIPPFQRLMDLIKALSKTSVTLNCTAYHVSNDVYNFDLEIHRCITDLMNNEYYTDALKLARIAGFNPSDVIIAQYEYELKQRMRRNEKIDLAFWKQCSQDFKKNNVCSEKVATFFVEHASENVHSHKERYDILRLSVEVLKDTRTEQQIIDKLEMAMWKSCILAGPQDVEFDSDDDIFNKLKTELMSEIKKVCITYTLDDEFEKDATKSLIDRLLDLGKLVVALRISAIFNHEHRDLQILMLCLSLADGEISPLDLTAEQKLLLSETCKINQLKYGTLRNRGLRRLSSSSSLNTSSLSTYTIPETNDTICSTKHSPHQLQVDCLLLLTQLLENLRHGTQIGTRIVLCYKLSIQLGKNYHLLLKLSDPIQFLQDIVQSSIQNKFEIANEIIAAYKIPNDSIAKWLAENVTINVTQAIEDGYEDAICIWGYPLDTNFHLLMELCNDVSLLGLRLLESASELLGHCYGETKNVSTLRVSVELLIRSHDCFSTSCNMEGIASVLRKCQNFSNVLQKLKLWSLLVRLVTGVGRFTEMNYIFQILKENDHFEFLLGQGLDKVSGLKMALLEFLKRNCPEDKELFTLVALHFCLYNEIALMWENEAKHITKELTDESNKSQNVPLLDARITRTEKVHTLLHLIITDLTHAAEYYLQDSKLNLANRCAQQAQLVAVQESLLSRVSYYQSVICILNLKTEQIERVLCHNLTFPQAAILVRAYDYHVDWANIIYSRWVLNGEECYLKDFITVKKLTASLAQDCVCRYRTEKNITQPMTENMKTLICELSDVECKYTLASQLGFKTIVENMLSDPLVGAYLKDTVWKKGYHP